MKYLFFDFILLFFLAILYSCIGSPNDSSKINTDKYYNIVSVSSEKCLEISDKADGTKLIQYTCNNSDKQKFKFIEVENEMDAYYIMSKLSDKYLDVFNAGKEDGANIIQWTPTKSENQVFILIEVEENKYNIISRNSNKLFDIPGNSMKDSVNVIQFSANNKENQLFELRIAE
jgi:hypothetical protein